MGLEHQAQRLTLNDPRATLVLRSTQVSGGPPLLDVDPRPGVSAPGLFRSGGTLRLAILEVKIRGELKPEFC